MVVYKKNVNATYWSISSFSRWCFSVCSLSANSSTNTSSSDMVGLIALSILTFAIIFLNFSVRSRYRSWTARLSSDFLNAGLVVFAKFSAAWSHNLAPCRRLILRLEGVYDQKLPTEHQIMVLCPFHVRISGDKEVTGPVKVFYMVVKRHHTPRKNCNLWHLAQPFQYSVTLKQSLKNYYLYF